MNERTFSEQLEERSRECGDAYRDRTILCFSVNEIFPEIQDNLRESMCDHLRKDIDEVVLREHSVPQRDSPTAKDRK